MQWGFESPALQHPKCNDGLLLWRVFCRLGSANSNDFGDGVHGVCGWCAFAGAIASLSELSVGGPPPTRPRALAAVSPAIVLSRLRSRSNSSSEPKDERQAFRLNGGGLSSLCWCCRQFRFDQVRSLQYPVTFSPCRATAGAARKWTAKHVKDTFPKLTGLCIPFGFN